MLHYLSTDEQTIEDLGIFARNNPDNIYSIYNRAHTRGGAALLESMFRNPLSDETAINQRSNTIEQFMLLHLPFPFDAGLFDMAEKYLGTTEHSHRSGTDQPALGEKEIQHGVNALIELMHLIKTFMERKELYNINEYRQEQQAVLQLLSDPEFEPVLRIQPKSKLSYAAITAFDTLFRTHKKAVLVQLLGHIYTLDVFMSVAALASADNFVFPKALPKNTCRLSIKGLYHPSLKNPVSNEVNMDQQSHLIFLTGANMAGKSTFLRALSTALYVAHMGFPVAATAMEFSVMDCLYTTINLPDNLGIGASHFYAEVLRVKKMAAELSSGKSCFILFDELFRGTNVKDAHEATVAVINGFARRRNSLFIISSHIVEAGDDLKQLHNIRFWYLPTRMNGHVPEYTYTLQQGITDDRHGMVIIRNEGIPDILKKGQKTPR